MKNTFKFSLRDMWLTSLVAQVGRNLPEMQETWVRSLAREDPLEKGMATHSFLGNSMDRGAWWAVVQRGQKESDSTERLTLFFTSEGEGENAPCQLKRWWGERGFPF